MPKPPPNRRPGPPGPPRQKQMPQRPTPRRQARAENQRPAIPKYVDVMLRVGLLDELVRFTPEGFAKFLNIWVIGGQDIIIRIPKQQLELDIVLRGTQSGTYRIRNQSTATQIPVADVQTATEMMEQHLAEQQRR